MYFYIVKIAEKYMMRCIDLAKKGLGTTYPNPLVGSVIIYNDKIIGEGWHEQAGKSHAEVNAIMNVKDQTLLKDSTIYVNLEPCSHFGKTPPCANLIIEKGIKNVIIGSLDPNPKVSGKGIEKLKKAGCKVTSGVLKSQCDKLNKRFFTFHINKRPYIILKWAQSLDNFIAPINTSKIQKNVTEASTNKTLKDAKPVWITNKFSRQLVHKWRSEEQDILVGTQTIIDDNPSLTTRDWAGKSPIRVVLDKGLRIPIKAKIYDTSVPTIIVTEKPKNNRDQLIFETINFSKDIISQLCNLLYEREIQSVIIEGGAKTLQTFIDSGIWDEARVFTGPIDFGNGIKAPEFSKNILSNFPKYNLEKTNSGDQLKIYIND